MSDELPLDPAPVRFGDSDLRNAQLGLLKSLPDMYSFDPRPGYSQDRLRYKTVEVVRRYQVIEGADSE